VTAKKTENAVGKIKIAMIVTIGRESATIAMTGTETATIVTTGIEIEIVTIGTEAEIVTIRIRNVVEASARLVKRFAGMNVVLVSSNQIMEERMFSVIFRQSKMAIC